MATIAWDPGGGGAIAIGLMSGTSRDGIDAALIATDGRDAFAAGPTLSVSYDAAFRASLASVMGGKGPIAEVERELTLRHAVAVQALIAHAGIDKASVRVVGFHGQTIRHEPARRRTWQIGDGALLARLTGIDVVNDFRGRDVAEGGQGAPLVPLFHALLARGLESPLAVLNLGGVANVTWIGAGGGPVEDRLLAFDMGPGNALLDDWAMRHTGRPFDRDGGLALRGRVDGTVLERLLADPFFSAPPPKSLDRDAFDPSPLEPLGPADGAATLAAFTAEAVARGAALFPAPPKRWLVAGGGRRNPTLMKALGARLAQPVEAVEAVGWDGDNLEAQAFAYLAVRSLEGLALSLPRTTGVPRPMTGGTLHRYES
jgi:anhydro-N-acetylmuramic acid kinase